MAFGKRIFLFLAINFLVVITASFVAGILMRVFGIEGEMAFYAVFYSIIGFGGAFFSLAISRWSAKKFMGVRVIDPRGASGRERELVEMVHDLAAKARLPAKPEVGIYESSSPNAFATGPSKRKSLVAVSQGLLDRMNNEELEGVLAHEVAHIANGDMVTMTLLMGLINTMVLLAARMAARAIVSQMRGRSWWLEFAIYMGLQVVFGVLGALVLNYFSRRREYRADAGGAKLAGSQSMLAGLRSLQACLAGPAMAEASAANSSGNKSYNYLQISGSPKSSWFSTHPPLESRIARLERMA